MIQALTSWRFVFALMIFMHHFTINNESLFFEGYCGVSFFFILSGFILSYVYGNEMTLRVGKNFILKRVSRLYPMHILCLCVVLLFGSSFYYSNFIANFLLLQSWIPKASFYFSYNAVSWCLSNEVFFYACFPFIGHYLYRITLKKQLIGICLISILIISLATLTPEKVHHFLFYICPLMRLSDFVLGMVVYNIYRYASENKLIALTSKNATLYECLSVIILLIFILCSNFVPQVYRYGIYYWLPMSFIVGTFAYFNNSKGCVSHILSQPLLVKLGMGSFCFYMIHVLCINEIRRIVYYFDNNVSWQLFFIITLFATTVLSLMCFRYFESPINKFLRSKFY